MTTTAEEKKYIKCIQTHLAAEAIMYSFIYQ